MTSNSWLYVAGAAATLLFGLIFFLALSRAHLQADLAALQGRYALCQSANQSFVEATAAANAEIEKQEAAFAERQKKAAAAGVAARKEAVKRQAALQTLLARKAEGDLCENAKRLLEDYARSRIGREAAFRDDGGTP